MGWKRKKRFTTPENDEIIKVSKDINGEDDMSKTQLLYKLKLLNAEYKVCEDVRKPIVASQIANLKHRIYLKSL